jgi:hypothetical protein
MLQKINSVHWQDGNLARQIYINNYYNKPLLHGMDQDINFFSDMECEIDSHNMFYAYTMFKELFNFYPQSKFILNIRKIDDWLLSRKRHIHNGHSYLDVICQMYNKNEQEVEDMWRTHWHTHIMEVLSFFRDKKEQLLVFDIDNNDHTDLFKFLKSDFKNLNKNVRFTIAGKTR